jgi:hypothetical protein
LAGQPQRAAKIALIQVWPWYQALQTTVASSLVWQRL